MNEFSNYWEEVREYYYPFESGLKAGTAEVYKHEIPGGQYSNLKPQAVALGLEDKFDEIKKNYAAVNQLFGNIVKVTPSSKVVGDMALYLTSNDLAVEDVMDPEKSLSFPDSVISLFKGELGQAYQGFPKVLQKIILKDEKAFTDRPNAHLEPIDFDAEIEAFQKKYGRLTGWQDFLSYRLYPKVYDSFHHYQQTYGDPIHIPTVAFLYGLKPNEETLVQISDGKTIMIKMLFVSEPDLDGMRTVSFELNGQTRRILVRDRSFTEVRPVHQKASEPNEIGAPLQGRLANVHVKKGDKVEENDLLFAIEAMKMETSITAPRAGIVRRVHLKGGTMVEQDDLVIEFQPSDT